MDISGKNLISKHNNKVAIWCLDFITVLFSVSLFTYLLLILVETLFEGSVSAYLNLDYLLILIIIVGIAVVLSTPVVTDSRIRECLTGMNKFLIIYMGIGGAVITWFKIQNIGWLSIIISVLVGGVITTLPMLIQQGDEGERIEEEDSQGN
jgi:hypothetical protein